MIPVRTLNPPLAGHWPCGDPVDCRLTGELLESERRLADILDFLPDATFAVDGAGRVIVWNRAIERMTGVTRDAVLGRDGFEHALPFYGERRPMLADLIIQPDLAAKALYDCLEREGDRLIAEMSGARFPGGGCAELWGIASPLFDAEGRLVGAIESVRDVSSVKHLQRDALRAHRETCAMIEALDDRLYMLDLEGRLLSWNQRVEDETGYSADQLRHRSFRDFFIEEDIPKVERAIQVVLAEGYVQVEGRARDARGEIRTCRYKGVLVRDEHGEPVGIAGVGHDITEQLQDQERLRLAAAVLASTREGVLVSDASGERIVAVNQSFVELSGYSEAEALANSPRLLQSGRHDRAFYQAMWAAIERTGYWQGEVWNRRRNGEIFPAWLSISQVCDALGAVTNYVGVISDISQVKQSEAQLERLAHYDPLTALPNRLLLTSRLEHAIQRAQRQQGRLAVLFIDLDRFKHVNDSLGHPTGDALLRAVADRLGQRIRREDTLARLGGDEFVVVLESLERSAEATNVAQSLIDAMAEPFQVGDGRTLYLGASIGISLYPDDGEEALQLLRNADTAMSQAKAQGRNSYRYYTASLTRAANRRLALESKLRRALEREEFVLHYQPQVAMADERIVGVEALVRWQDPEEGLIPPDRFIPLAEETGLIVPLGDWVMRQACRQMRQWRDAGLPPLTLAVNLSAQQFAQPGLAEQVAALLAETALPADCLELELTESILMQHNAHGQASLDALRALGVALSIDDFGTGYSSLAYLKRLPIDKLKIDKSFVQGIPDDRNDAEIATTVIAMARNLRLRVLAEGVETIAQRDFLRAAGCDTYQGYLFSRPVTPDVIADLCLDRTDADPATASAPLSRQDRDRLA